MKRLLSTYICGLLLIAASQAQTITAIELTNGNYPWQNRLYPGDTALITFWVLGGSPETDIEITIANNDQSFPEVYTFSGQLKDFEKSPYHEVTYVFRWELPDTILHGVKTIKVNGKPLSNETQVYLGVHNPVITGISNALPVYRTGHYAIYDLLGRKVTDFQGSNPLHAPNLPTGHYVYIFDSQYKGKFIKP